MWFLNPPHSTSTLTSCWLHILSNINHTWGYDSAWVLPIQYCPVLNNTGKEFFRGPPNLQQFTISISPAEKFVSALYIHIYVCLRYVHVHWNCHWLWSTRSRLIENFLIFNLCHLVTDRHACYTQRMYLPCSLGMYCIYKDFDTILLSSVPPLRLPEMAESFSVFFSFRFLTKKKWFKSYFDHKKKPCVFAFVRNV